MQLLYSQNLDAQININRLMTSRYFDGVPCTLCLPFSQLLPRCTATCPSCRGCSRTAWSTGYCRWGNQVGEKLSFPSDTVSTQTLVLIIHMVSFRVFRL